MADLSSLSPSEKSSRTSGGTAAMLPAERARATFDSERLQEFLSGGAEQLKLKKKWRDLFESNPLFDRSEDTYHSREETFKKSLARALESYKILRANRDLLNTHMPGGAGQSISSLSHNYSGVSDHYALFVGTLWTQATPQQSKEWLKKAMDLEIIGTYAQTELGHGSNVRGLETTAQYFPETEEFEIDSPTLTSLKWWPGALGVIATHALIYARLIIKGKDYGFHSFMVQLRDENHKPLPGVVVGDLGPKIGYESNDSGYCAFDKVRIPRFNMLARFQQVTKEGEYVKPPGGMEKIGYLTMTKTRVGIAVGAFSALAMGTTIAIRYNAVRQQGFVDTKAADPHARGERTILDYQVQQYHLFSELAMAYAIFFVTRHLLATARKTEEKLRERDLTKIDPSLLPELHATSSGLKSFCTTYAADGLEVVRRCCGGQGYAMSGGIGSLLTSYIPAVTYEGDRFVMGLQTARFLVQAAQRVREGKSVADAVSYLSDPGESSCPLRTSEDFQNPEALADVFKQIACNSIFAAEAGLRESTARGLSFDDAWNDNQVLLLKCAEAHVLFTMIHSFANAAKELSGTHSNIGDALSKLCALFGVVQLKSRFSVDDIAGYIGVEQLAGMNRALKVLLLKIRPNAIALTDAFGFSDKTLNSCIGRHDGNVYEAVYSWAVKSPLNSESWQQEVWKELLSPVLNRDYIKNAKLTQKSKL